MSGLVAGWASGHQRARQAVLVLVALQFGLVVGLLGQGVLQWPVLLVVFSLPFPRKLIVVYRAPTPSQAPADYPRGVWPLWYSAHGFVPCRNFGLLYITALLVSQIVGCSPMVIGPWSWATLVADLLVYLTGLG